MSLRGSSSSKMMNELEEEENLSDDDNAQIDLEEAVETEDPLLLAIDDLEGRVISAVDELKLHPGVKTAASADIASSVHEELSILLRPVLEVAAHTGPSVARTYYRGVGPEGIEASVEDAYERIISDLVLPVMLEIAQSDTMPAKRCASLEFFRNLWNETHKAGSWLDSTNVMSPNSGPYGPGGSHSAANVPTTPAMRAVMKRRQVKRQNREGEILRYWVEAACACLVAGVFTDEDAEGAVVSRAIIAASASLRPALSHVALRIRDTDDRGASRLYGPVMKMVEGVLKKLVLGSSENVRAAAIKFLEIVILCCSHKPQDATKKRGPVVNRKSMLLLLDDKCSRVIDNSHLFQIHAFISQASEAFSLDELPTGHPVITRESLESIAEYAYTTLRGMALMGGQVKIDVNILSDMLLTSAGDGASQVVSILKPAALAYLDIESSVLPKSDEQEEDLISFPIDRTSVEFDFLLSQKSYALTINALSALAINRPVFFKESAICLARRTTDPPIYLEGSGLLTKAATLAIASQLKASCLTLLRNALSVTTGASDVLVKALKSQDMEIQAEKAFKMANQANSLKTAGRAARNRANMYYEWDASESDRRSTKRQRETDADLAKMRAKKAAIGLGKGIQLPTSMSDAIELILLNLTHLPSKPPASTKEKARTAPVTLDFVVDAILTNGASLWQEEGRWYHRDGGLTWEVDLKADVVYQLRPKMLETLEQIRETDNEPDDKGETGKHRKLFLDQCKNAASDAMGRIMAITSNSRSKYLTDLGNQLASRLAFTLRGVNPSQQQLTALRLAKESVATYEKRATSKERIDDLTNFIDSYPLVASSLAYIATTKIESSETIHSELTLDEYVLNEALMQSCCVEGETRKDDAFKKYDQSLDLFVATVVHAGELANEKPSDSEKKKAAIQASAALQRDMVRLPRLTGDSIKFLAGLCDIEGITKKASDASKKTSQDSIAAAASAHAAKVAAEKRATTMLLLLRDIAFQRDIEANRRNAVACAVGIASGRHPTNPVIHDKALKLTINVIFPKNEKLENMVVEASIADLELAAAIAVQEHDNIQKANKETEEKGGAGVQNPLSPRSEKEKQVMERMRKPAVLVMALCVRRPEIIQTLFSVSCRENADVLSKTVRVNMSKLSKAVAAKHGTAAIALQVAGETSSDETPMLLAFLENLSPGLDKPQAELELINACFKIQELKLTKDGRKDPRYLIPVVSAMKRKDLVERLPEFVDAEDRIFLAALVRMGDRVSRSALLFREELDPENPSLHGMTLCEQLVFLHRLDFGASGIPQKRYLEAIKLCLEDDDVFNDRVLMAAIDEMSGKFLAGSEKLPLAFMRTNILVCTKHESLHSWICNVLLPRLVEGEIWNDPRQFEGWMRLAHMLERSGDSSVSSQHAIEMLPPEQLMQYRTKWAGK